MDWSVMLGPTNQAIPHDKWDEFRERGLIYVWDVMCKSYGPGSRMSTAHLVRYDDNGKKMQLDLGHLHKSSSYGGGWDCFGQGIRGVDGFGTRRAAIAYLLDAHGYVRRRNG